MEEATIRERLLKESIETRGEEATIRERLLKESIETRVGRPLLESDY